MRAKTSPFAHLRVLVVDDNRFMRRLVSGVLRAFGVTQIVEAAEATDALKALKVGQTDVMILDLMMEPIGGLEVLRLLRHDRDMPRRDLPVIVLTAHTEAFWVFEARDAGADEFLLKPFTADGLYSRLRAVAFRQRTFVNGPGYIGPERRRKFDMAFQGPERRQGITAGKRRAS